MLSYTARTTIMRMEELIAGIMDLIDQASRPKPQMQAQITVVSTPHHEPAPADELSPLTQGGDDINRFRQIVALANQPEVCPEFENEPNPQYAGIEAVTTHAGGGMNGPKNPSDLRGDKISLYPAHQHGVR